MLFFICAKSVESLIAFSGLMYNCPPYGHPRTHLFQSQDSITSTCSDCCTRGENAGGLSWTVKCVRSPSTSLHQNVAQALPNHKEGELYIVSITNLYQAHLRLLVDCCLFSDSELWLLWLFYWNRFYKLKFLQLSRKVSLWF